MLSKFEIGTTSAAGQPAYGVPPSMMRFQGIRLVPDRIDVSYQESE